MLVYRYMGIEEFNKVIAGVEISSDNKFKNCRTTSEGICFLPEIVKFWSDSINDTVEFSPVDCFRFLNGVVSSKSILVEFETQEELNQSSGVYADPYTDDWDATICIDELCTKSYNRDTFIPKRYSFPKEDIWYNLV